MKSNFACPECGKPLDIELSGDKINLFCAFGPCESQLANNGGEGQNEQEAFDALKITLDNQE